ncbi:MAG TPA: dihydrofolate reductase family protein [Terriglobales bacterium]
MPRLIVSNIMSLDGFFESAEKKLDWFQRDEDFFSYARDMLRATETLIFGRLTYEHMAAYWPSAPKEEIADAMNNLPKIVFTRTLTKAAWNNTRLINTDPAEEIARLKRQPGGKTLTLLGSAALASYLLQKNLIDEYRVILIPVLLGRGTPMFHGINEWVHFKLERTTPLKSGTIVLYYQPRQVR